MKRIIVLTFLALFGFTAAQAQKQVAMLTHGENTTVYYGSNALVDAVAAAASGDVINLSSGNFAAPPSSIEVTSLTIRGAGRYPDTALGVQPTVISGGDMCLWADSLTFEGLHITGSVSCGNGTAHSQFIDCFFEYIGTSGQFQISDCEFIQCNLKMENQPISGSTFTNCVVIGEFGPNCVCNNCVMNAWNNDVVAYNSIITYRSPSTDPTYAINNNNLSNCVGIGVYYRNGYACFYSALSTSARAGNYSYAENEIFSSYLWRSGNYYYGISYTLTAAAAATYLGSDGTQVGVYGGMAPWGHSRGNKVTVPNQSRTDGKLEVTIQSVNQ